MKLFDILFTHLWSRLYKDTHLIQFNLYVLINTNNHIILH